MKTFLATALNVLMIVSFTFFHPMFSRPSYANKAAPQNIIELRGANTIIFDQEITVTTADVLLSSAIGKRIMNPDGGPIYIVLVSPGGDVKAALMLREMLNTIPNLHMVCKYCASAAAMVFASANHPRMSLSNSIMLMHELYVNHVTASMVLDPNFATSLIISDVQFNKIIADALKIPIEEYVERITGTEWQIEGGDLLKNHASDMLVTVHCDEYIKVLAPVTCSGK